MANTARSAFRTAVGLNLQGRTDLSSQIDAGLNAALEEISYLPWRELLSRNAASLTVASTQYISLPSDIEELLMVQLVDQVTFADGVLSETGDTFTLPTATVGYDDGTRVQFSAGTMPTDMSLLTNYYMGELGGDGLTNGYNLYDTLANAVLNDGSTGLVDLEDSDPVTAIVGNGTQNYVLEILRKEEAERRYPMSDARDQATIPAACYREGSRLYLTPMPNAVWAVRMSYRANLTLASGDSATISSAGFDNLLIAYTTAYVLESLEHGKESAGRWWRIYERHVGRKMLSQQTTGTVDRVDTRVSDRERYRDPYTYLPAGVRRWP